jgi:small subunit ribosomal protein S7
MPRRRVVAKREIHPDPKYNDLLVAKFINTVMYQGKKSVSEGAIYAAFELIEERRREDPVKVFRKALENVQPVVEVKSRRVGGATYQVPVEVRPQRRMALAMRWLRDYARERAGRTYSDRLASELMDAAEGRGSSVKKKDDVHKMAEANKAFSHYRW